MIKDLQPRTLPSFPHGQPLNLNQVCVQLPLDLEHVWSCAHSTKTALGGQSAARMGVAMCALSLCWKAVSLVGYFTPLDPASQLAMDATHGECSE